MDDFDRIKYQLEIISEEKQKNADKLKIIQDNLPIKHQVRNFLISFSEYSRNIIKEKLESLVNSALKCVFADKELIFRLLPNKTKRGLFYELFIETDGELTPLMDSKGGGVLDVITIALRISFLRLFSGKLRQVLILDEVFKNLDSDRVEVAIEWLKLVSKDFGIQLIMVTHIDKLIEKADVAYHFVLVNGETKVAKIK